MGWLETIFRTLLFWLDSIVYKFIPTVYNLLVNIAETSIFSEDVFTLFSNRIYTLLGVFMLFKVSFSILTYIVDPDAFTDKNKGFGKLISNIIMTLALLIFTPYIFTYAMELQGIILKDNLIGKLFSTNGVNTTVVADPGNTMAYETFKAFYYFDVDRYPECDSDNFTGNNADFSCIDNISSIEDTASLRKNLEYAHFTGSISVYLDSGIAIMRDSNDNYVMTYTTIFSTITGVVMILLLIVFCFDIAVRSVKLGFLRMLAPVPIISRIDPKKGKEVFDKWVKTCINTYLDLFIRLLAIYFAIFVITQIIDLRFVDAVTGQEMGEVNPFVKVFIILGALMFAKQLPKLISDLTGMKMDGKFTLNPLKKMSEVPIAGKAANLAIGGADSWIHGNGFMAGVKRNWKNIPITGGDGKTSIFDTADRKMRKEINEKRDMARQKYEGKKDFNDIHEKWEKGDKVRQKFDGLHVSNPTLFPNTGNDFAKNFDDGNNLAAYKAAYRNDQFIQSLMKVDQQDAKNKSISNGLEIVKAGGTFTYNGITYSVSGTGHADSLADLNAEAIKASKTLEGLKAVHETMRKTYSDDAKTQDAITFRKNNHVDPTI